MVVFRLSAAHRLTSAPMIQERRRGTVPWYGVTAGSVIFFDGSNWIGNQALMATLGSRSSCSEEISQGLENL